LPSELAIFDLKTGTAQTVLQTARLIEAPNWTPDGKALIVNGDGRLYRVSLDGPARLDEIDTGFAIKLNNDHGISPDGRQFVISDSTENGQSCIYVLPVEGGTPRKITKDTPSYWHGWSPDGATLAYCAARNNIFDIYVSDLEGRTETRLTDGKGHSDGPDYTPDGLDMVQFKPHGTVQRGYAPDGSAQADDDELPTGFPPSPMEAHSLSAYG
jgi:Tol biopolymer transport system component